MTPALRKLEMTVLGLGFLGLAWARTSCDYAAEHRVEIDVEGQIAYLIDIFGNRRFMPPGFDLRARRSPSSVPARRAMACYSLPWCAFLSRHRRVRSRRR